MERQFNSRHGAVARNFDGGEPFYVRYRQSHDWKTRSDAKRIGGRLYEVTLADGSTSRFHANQMPLRYTPPCNFNGDKRNMHQRHLTGSTTELIPRASLVGPTGVSKCVSYTDTFRALSGHLSRLSLFEGKLQMLVVAISFP